MANSIVYGPITIRNVIIRSMECTSVLGDDRLQVRYKKYVFDFAGHVNSDMNAHRRNGLALSQGATPVANAASVITADAVFLYLSKPRQYFRLDMDEHVFLEYPYANHTMDSAMGPFTSGIKVTNISGSLGYDVGGYFMVSGRIEVCVDFLSPDSNSETHYIQGYSMVREHDVNGDNMLTTIVTTILVYGRPEAIRSIEGGGSQSVWAYFADLSQLMSYVPPGFKRRRAKVQVKPSGTEAAVTLVDDELHLPLGGNSPASSFTPTQTDRNHIGGGEKEGAPSSIRVVTINAICPKNDTRERVIGQMIYWLTVKTMGGSGRGAADRSARFVYYREITLVIDYATNGLTMSAVCVLHFPKSGPWEIPFSVKESRLGAVEDYGDVDYALQGFRAAVDEPLQGTERGLAISPRLNYHGTAGSYIAEIYADRIKHGYANALKNPVDGNKLSCGPGYQQSPGFESDPYIAPANTDFLIESKVTEEIDELTLAWQPESSLSYESTWMQTKYQTDHGRAVLPTGGVIPDESYNDEDMPTDRVEIQVHMGRTIKVVTWGIQCVGDSKPIYPDKNTYNVNDIFIGERIQPAAPVPVGLGVMAYTITGTYYYDCLDIRGCGTTLPVGKLPITTGEQSDYAIPGGNAASGYIPT